MKIIRVFPRRTRCTPTDINARIGEPDLFDECDRVHISVTFTYDIPEAERLCKLWEKIAPVEIGGPAINSIPGEFIPGMYLKPGYTITSRGCPNNCLFCDVPKREGAIRELEIKDGHNVLDSNLLACSDKHIINVFSMLNRQKHAAEFTGGLEAARLKEWHVKMLSEFRLKPKQLFFAYDTPNDREPLFEAGKLLAGYGLNKSHRLRCYVLIGYKGDTFDKAESRLKESIQAGFIPAAMLYRDKNNTEPDMKWKQFQRAWIRPAIIWNKRRI